MITPDSKCFNDISVGDAVVIKLLPYDPHYRTFKESFLLPVIGWYNNIPIAGTMAKELYKNHRFNTMSYFFNAPELRKWKYFIILDKPDICIERVIKGGAKFNSSHLQR